MSNNMHIHDNDKIIYLDDYIKKKIDGNYSGELEIYCISKVFNNFYSCI